MEGLSFSNSKISKVNQVAVFLDLDNIEIESKKKFNEHLDPVKLKKRCMEIGRIRYLGAYADFQESTALPLREKLAQEAYDIHDLPSLGIHKKNSADIQIVVDALSIAYEFPDLDTFVLITGDADFNPLIKKLRQSGKRIIVIGLEASTATILKKNCDQFVAYEDIIKEKDEVRLHTKYIEEEIATMDSTKIPYINEFLRALRVTEEQAGIILVSRLKEVIVQLDPSFNETKFGKKSFSDFLKIFEDHNIIKITQKNTTHIVEMQDLSVDDWNRILKG